jgi:hypothetical protein
VLSAGPRGGEGKGVPRATKAKGSKDDDSLDCCSVSSSRRSDERTSRNDGRGRCLRVNVRM